MTTIILDVSANTHQNNENIMDEIFASVPADLHGHEIVFKTQYWQPDNKCAEVNTTCTPDSLHAFMCIAGQRGFRATASVFDLQSLLELLLYQPCFVKIACRPELYHLIGEVPRKIPVMVSIDSRKPVQHQECCGPGITRLSCVPTYPAKVSDYLYPWKGGEKNPTHISDHTVGLELWQRDPEIYECHYVLERNKDNPDAADFAKTPEDLKEMLDA